MEQHTTESEQKLVQSLERLNSAIARQNSLRFIILKGVVYGVSTVVGATIVAGIVFSMISATTEKVEDVPLLEKVTEIEVK